LSKKMTSACIKRDTQISREMSAIRGVDLLRYIRPSGCSIHRRRRAVRLDANVVPIFLADVFLVHLILNVTTLAIVLFVEQVLLRVVGLVNVITPGVQ
jgi:hypothetical protein